MSKREDVEWFQEHLSTLPEKFLDCRDMMHAWKRSGGYRPVGAAKGNVKFLKRAVVCTRCGTEREDVYSMRTMDKVSTSYHYPEGYQIKGNRLRAGRGQSVRRELLLRLGYTTTP